MVLLAFFSVATIWHEGQYNDYIVWGIWLIFFLDFCYRFFLAKNKLYFLRKNPFVVIAVIPFDAIFQLARVARILHLLRLKTIAKYYTKPIIKKLKKKKFSFLFPFTFIFIFLMIIPLQKNEPSLNTYQEAFFESLMILVIFGFTTIEPVSIVGKIIIVLITIFGVILHGLVINYLFTIIFESKTYKNLRKKLKKDK